MHLTDQQTRYFDTFGFLKFPGLFEDEIGLITEAFETVWAESGIEHRYVERSYITPFADRHEYLSALLDDPRIDGVVRRILLLPHQKMLPDFWRLLIDAHRSQVNWSHLIDLAVFGAAYTSCFAITPRHCLTLRCSVRS